MKKGFTLIELLAVIVILAVIALIAVPVILNIIKESEKGSFKDSAYGIMKSAENYYVEEEVKGNADLGTLNISDLSFKGEKPDAGEVGKDVNGNIAIYMWKNSGKLCVYKNFTDKDVTLDETLNDSNSCKEKVVLIMVVAKKLSQVATTSSIITSIPSCVNSGICSQGLPIAIKVNPTTTYNFNVVSDNGTKIVLMMDRNIKAIIPDSLTEEANVLWASKTDYLSAGGTETDWSEMSTNIIGPVTALNTLASRTTNWSNIRFNYILSDDGGGAKYPSSNKEGVHARLLTYTEAIELGCVNSTMNTCPLWMNQNLYETGDETTYAYWTSAAYPSGNPSYIAIRIQYRSTYGDGVTATSYGIRPVIELSKI